MQRRWRVTLCSPPGYTHAKAFAELAMLLRYTMADLGQECDMAVNALATDRRNILLGYHLIGDPAMLAGNDYVVYQLEQLGPGGGVISAAAQKVLEEAGGIWDYSSENVAWLSRMGLRVTHLPVGFHPALRKIKPCEVPETDIFFYGSLNDRRRAVLAGLREAGLRVDSAFGVYGDERDALIARSRIVLNVHHYPAQIFEQVRVSYLLNNRCCVVSEASENYPYPGVDLPVAAYDRLVETCLLLAASDGERDRLAGANHEEFARSYDMRALVRERILALPPS